jgi:hypothetical protein
VDNESSTKVFRRSTTIMTIIYKIIMSRTNLGSPSYYFSCSAPKLESIQNGSPKKEFFDASR